MNQRDFVAGVLAVALIGIGGCGDENAQLADYAMESARWQAEQSQTLVEANQQIADGSRQLVAADAASRQELATLQRELRADQADIAQQYQSLAERHTQWVDACDRDAQAGSSILGLALILACLLPLLLAAWAMFGRHDPPTAEEIEAVLNQTPPSVDCRKEPHPHVAYCAHQNPSS
jgi:hypothetical protein